MKKLLSIIIPCFNEEKTISLIIEKIYLLKNLDIEVIVVDDGSTDLTREILTNLKEKYNFALKIHTANQGKGSAIKTAQQYVNGDVVIIQDADLEYDPNDYYELLTPIIQNKYKVVYGSRVLGKNVFQNLKNFSHWIRIIGNLILTKISNLINNQKLTDAHTCYKVFDANLFKSIRLSESNFNFCPEITTKISNLKIEICEVPISYMGRNYDEGKKISTLDAFRAIKTLIKYKLFKNA